MKYLNCLSIHYYYLRRDIEIKENNMINHINNCSVKKKNPSVISECCDRFTTLYNIAEKNLYYNKCRGCLKLKDSFLSS